MKLAYYTKNPCDLQDPSIEEMFSSLRAGGCDCYEVMPQAGLAPGTDVLVSIGGDGTFLSASHIAAMTGVPVLGVNRGRLGFLSDIKPGSVAQLLLQGGGRVEARTMLSAVYGKEQPLIALNEVSVTRVGTGILGIDVCLDGQPLPTYWADGLLVSTSSGSTAYSLSAGGPICLPDSKVLIITPIAPHNLNVRPLVVPESSEVEISFKSRDSMVALSADTSRMMVPASVRVGVRSVPDALKILNAGKSGFIEALSGKLFWGEDIRNAK
ncbi:MAG: NAD(+)/NADH kinase [Bacteroidales bacterium]|nr:NAD(+)/NADH kinase [Bacteroidales bacterium]